MPARFTEDCVISWHGTDDTTPPGYTLAVGRDTLGTMYLWLFKGPDATVDAFAGSISIPALPGRRSVLYDQGGGYAGTVSDTREALAKLAARGDTE